MAFFGLTMLGDETPFNTYHTDILTLPFVLDGDLKAAFHRHGDEGLLDYKDIASVLKATYKGETKHYRHEAAAIASKLAGDKVTLEEFMAAVEEVRASIKVESMKKTPLEYKSNSDFREKMARHTRTKDSPKDRFGLPLTSSQVLGWEEPIKEESAKVYKPLTNSYESKYADAMIRSGIYY